MPDLLSSPRPSEIDPLTLDQHDAARLSGLSAKTLERLAAAGEPVGRIKVGRRVLFVKSQLESWLLSRVGATNPTLSLAGGSSSNAST